MTIIFESPSFVVEARAAPHVSRSDGGHITIGPRERIVDRQHLAPEQAIELMRLTVVVGEAMTGAMNERGVDIGRINYQDNGNWGVFAPEGPHLHIQLYGRARSATLQPYGQALVFPHKDEHPEAYADLEPLTSGDVDAIRARIDGLLAEERFSDAAWGLA